ncbi:MAG: NAD-dependent epimerase/dehydratase family protein [Actinomycetota bacterium]
MKVLVTGGAGFIGSHIVDELVERGDQVRVLDNLHPMAHAARPDYLNPDAEYLIDDLRDRQAAAAAVRGVDAVCHQAGVVGLGVDFGDVTDYVDTNDTGSAVLLRELFERSFAGPLVLAGSMVVYGEGRYRCVYHGVVSPPPRTEHDLATGRFDPACPSCGLALNNEAVPENAPPKPRSIYAATKLHQEHLFECYARETDARYVGLRYHNVYGSRMPFNTPYAGVASIFRSCLERGEPPQVFEDGKQIRDFVHVSDVARANVLALTDGTAKGPFNVASGDPRPLLDMAETLCSAFGDGSTAPEITGRYRAYDIRHVFADPERAREELGFQARMSFEEGMKRFIHDPIRASLLG